MSLCQDFSNLRRFDASYFFRSIHRPSLIFVHFRSIFHLFCVSAHEDEDIVIDETKSKNEAKTDEDEDEDETSKVTDEEKTSNSSDGQRSPPPSMVYGPMSMMSQNMMYMSHYMNPYMQVYTFTPFCTLGLVAILFRPTLFRSKYFISILDPFQAYFRYHFEAILYS